ncbi:MAG TPA: CinA family protein [Tepidisphaeraceae bacterium]|nr:CinA family protein [Tepidisphaeraceae bacterium]
MTPETSIECSIFDRLSVYERTLATAESCTGGLVAHRLTNVPGMSEFFLGGVVAYSNAAKMKFLGVGEADLASHGAVSEPVARQMAEGARAAFNADLGIGITGIAGPGGGTPEKPVGLVFIAVAGPGGSVVKRNVFPGTREQIKDQTAETALRMVLEYLT